MADTPISTSAKLFDVMSNVTEDDLQQLQSEINVLATKLAALRKLARIVAAFLGKPVEAKEASSDKPVVSILDKRKSIVQYLAGGSKNGHDIIRHCKIQSAKLNEIMNCSWFNKVGNTYHITTEARRECL